MFTKEQVNNMSDNKILSYLCHDFYHVEHDETGKAWIHDNGYCYGDGPEDGYDDDGNINPDWFYRCLEYTWLYLDPVKLKEDDTCYDIAQADVTQYIEDCNEEKIIKILRELLINCTELHMENVTDETPDGWYVD